MNNEECGVFCTFLYIRFLSKITLALIIADLLCAMYVDVFELSLQNENSQT